MKEPSMTASTDLMLLGTGEFAARLLFDIAASADQPVRVTVVGRSAPRLAWLRTAANARAVLFGRPVRFETRQCADFETDTLAGVLAQVRPRVVIQTASLQTASVLRSSDNAWGRLVANGGLSVTAAFQTVLSLKAGRAIAAAAPGAHYLNACFPDVTNGLLRHAGVDVLCGVGNVGILSNAFAGALDAREPGRVQVLAHYQQLGLWRRLPGERQGSVPRVWLDGREIDDVPGVFQDVMLSPQTAFDISGATGVPLALALAAGRSWSGHVPAPEGLPGGYPVRVDEQGAMALDLPAGLPREEAIAWNARFERDNGLVIDGQGNATYTGVLYEELRRHDAQLAQGFAARDVEQAAESLAVLRDRLQAQAC
ncbi:hypothetical protein B7P02_05300 [Bordetella bronchiseptica]|nr:hypothetical protein B7P02_05300 [Bordetella bronchiseptica]RSB96942.1 hypothetical protein EGT31_01565 [Bordetella bronchiseptica]RSC05994.1 hypothetical protein EGT23_04420 [Bordetella bronchiseptica]